MVLVSFRSVRPRYEARQEEILSWLVDIHTRAELEGRDGADACAVRARMARLIRHVCCGSDRIASRGYTSDDTLYAVVANGGRAGTAARTDLFAREVEGVFAQLYDTEPEPPDDLVHVTCTGYVSPSAAQQLVSNRGWGERTHVTHAYHMGCYAAVPALRIATGLAAAKGGRDTPPRIDVVHSELCSLHFDASVHTPEQLVVQSLFADGSIRYRVRADGDGGGEPGLRILALHEEIVADSGASMGWRLGDHGMRMTLARDIPDQLARAARPFVTTLLARAGLDLGREHGRCVFAIHPGGPKIIDVVQTALEASDAQVAASRDVLRRFGNMSSSTVPHIWRDVLEDPGVARGTLIASLAFGPGLTCAGALLRKE